MKESELKCPWGCNGRTWVQEDSVLPDKKTRYMVFHDCMHMSRWVSTNYFDTSQLAMKNWNSWIKP